ncbi:MAG: hypothetical protein AB1896_12815 [Thermodesulfobacteriota bacterium]
MTKPHSPKITIRGQVVPYEYDAEDNVIGVLIADDEDKDYHVQSSELGRGLIDYLDEYVEVTGTVQVVEGEYHLTITDFELVEEPEIDFDENYEDLDDEDDFKVWD